MSMNYKTVKEEAPSWVLSFLITLLLTMQVNVRADDISAQRIEIVGGETLYAWDDSWSPQELDIEQHIPARSPRSENSSGVVNE